MSKRTQIIESFINHIAESTGYRGYRGLRFLHEVNTFPAFYVHARNETRTHSSSGAKLCILSVDVRGYGWSDQLSYIEDLVRNLEVAVQSYKPLHRALVHEARVTSLRTDEGAMHPYCICDMSIEILYGINNE